MMFERCHGARLAPPLFLAATLLCVMSSPARGQEGVARSRSAAVAGAPSEGSPASTRSPSPSPVRLSLADAVARAMRDAAGVELAGAAVSQSEAMARFARSELLPDVSATAGLLDHSLNRRSFGFDFSGFPGAPTSDLVGPFSVYDARLHLRQTLVDVAAWKRMSAAGAGVSVAELQRDAAAEEAAVRAARAYLEASRAAALLEAYGADVALADELLALAREQLEAGVATAIDVTRARTERLSAEVLLREAESRRAQADIALARATHLDASSSFDLTGGLATGVGASDAPAVAEAATALALEVRPELRVRHALGERARAAGSAIRAERLPRLEVVAAYGVNGPEPDNVLATREVGLQLSVPLVAGLGLSARLDEQDARVRAAEIGERDMREQIEAEVATALAQLEASQALGALAAQRLELAEEGLAQARARFANGLTSNIELINAQASLNRARTAEIESRYRAAAARVELARAAGVARTLH